MTALPYTTIGLGTPIVDHVVQVDDEFIRKTPAVRGGSEPVSYEILCEILKQSNKKPTVMTGGCAANTIKGIAQLGHLCAFVGKIGKDEAGEYFSQTLKDNQIIPCLSIGTKQTAQVACLITPDHERTMLNCLGAGLEMSPQDLPLDLFKNVKLVYIEGFMLTRESVVTCAMDLAKQAGAKIAFDLCSFEIVGQYKARVIDLISNFVDILFANTEEAHVLTGVQPERSCNFLKDLCETVVVKAGAQGCFAANNTEKIFQPAFPVKAIDTTGAGDLFASGFLHGYMHEKSLADCARYGSLVASKVVQVMGAELSPEMWLDIKSQL